MRLPRVIGHRGAAALAPENTLEGLRVAARLGLRWVEVDAKLSADGGGGLFPDERLEGATDGTGPAAGRGPGGAAVGAGARRRVANPTARYYIIAPNPNGPRDGRGA